MIHTIKELYGVLTSQQRYELLRLQLLVILMAFAEVSGVASIGPFLSLASNPDQLYGDNFFAYVYSYLEMTDSSNFIFLAGLAVLMILLTATIISTVTVRYLLHYAQRLGANFSNSLYEHYMSQPWLFHASGNSSQLMNNITTECSRVTQGIIYPVMIMNAKAALALCIIGLLIILNPIVTLLGFSVFAFMYFIIFSFVKLRVAKNGISVTKSQKDRFQLMNEGFGGIKDILLLGRSFSFKENFSLASIEYGRANSSIATMNEVPKFWVELIAFGAMVSLILFLLASNNGSLTNILPQLGIFAMASYKLMPAFQQVYGNLTYIKGSASALNSIKSDLLNWKQSERSKKNIVQRSIVFKNKIEFKNVSFKYPNKDIYALKDINLEIISNSTVGFVGSSGSGKSTLIDLVLGLMTPTSGSVLIDNKPLNENSLRAWQDRVGYVPQSFFLSDSSIKANVAFGLPQNQINLDKVQRAIKLANLESFVKSLPNGLDEIVGEKGVQLSGGQKQRIAIARALYNDPEVLVFDEATSALDGLTEKVIMDAIYNLSNFKTIILVAHRLNTVKKCDRIFFFENGSLVDSDSFENMKAKNKQFQKMSDYS